MSTRLGLLGGSFNPIHFGHLISARAVAEQLQLSRMLLIPAAAPPHKPAADLADAEHRLTMTRLAVEGDPLFEVSDMEVRRAGPSYTFDTLTALRAELGSAAELFWVIGADTLPELESWYRISDLVTLAEIVTTVRPGRPEIPGRLAPLEAKIGPGKLASILARRLATPAIEISATQIRERVRDRKSIRYLTPDAVIAYIQKIGLFSEFSGA